MSAYLTGRTPLKPYSVSARVSCSGSERTWKSCARTEGGHQGGSAPAACPAGTQGSPGKAPRAKAGPSQGTGARCSL